MHSFDAPSGRTYHHNGDFSGDVVFTQSTTEDGSLEDVDVEVEVPFADLKALVAQHVRNVRIEWIEQTGAYGIEAVSWLEQASDDEVLMVNPAGTPGAVGDNETHRLHRAVLALRGMLVAAGVATGILNDVVGDLTCASCHLAPITENDDPELPTVEALPDEAQGVTSATRVIKLQPAEFIDNISDGGHVGTKLPYPFYVNEAGEVANQEFWRGDPLRVVGFQRDLARHEVDLWWNDAFADPERCVGMYLVTADNRGGMGVHQTAIASVEVLER